MDSVSNQIRLRGSLLGLPEFSHENHGRRFCRFTLEVPRLSGTVDLLPVIAPEALVGELDPFDGEMLCVTGQVRSHDRREETRRRLMIFVFASEIKSDSGEPENSVHVEGIVCREPVLRRTPLGREICDVMLAAPRAFHRCDYLPCILWGRTAQEAALCRVQDRLHIDGRLQSRAYTKRTEQGAQERTAYEISALRAQMPDAI